MELIIKMKIDKFKVEEWFNEYEHKAVYDLADTCVESLSVDELLKIAKLNNTDEIFSRKLNYGDIHGSEKLKELIANLYEKQNPQNITVTHGTIGANQLVMLTLIEPKDKVVSIIPTYQQHYSIPKSIGADVKILKLKEENNWLPELDKLEQLVSNNTKIICMNNPNNPTGAVIPDEMLEKIVDIARKSDAYILCDEVYRGLCHNEQKPFSKSITDIYEKGISTSSMSKVFSLAGLRLGWVCANEKIIDQINHQREYNTISVGILDDYFSCLAIENKEQIIKRNISKILEGKCILEQWLKNENKADCVLPNAGTTAFVRYNIPVKSTELCKRLQDDTGVMILPGETMEMDNYLRIGYGNNPEKLKKALEIFSEWLNLNFTQA